MDTFGSNALAVLRAGFAGSIAAGVMFAIWMIFALTPPPPLSSISRGETLVNLLAVALFWPVAIGIAGAVVTVPLTAIFALIGAAILRMTSWSPSLPLRIGGFLVGTFAWWFVFNRGAPDQVMIFGNLFSAPSIGGIAGFAAGHVLARHWV